MSYRAAVKGRDPRYLPRLPRAHAEARQRGRVGVGSSGSLLAPPFARLSTYRKNEHPESERHSGSRVLACLRPFASAASPNSRSRPFRFSASDLFDWEPAAESGQREPREGERRGPRLSRVKCLKARTPRLACSPTHGEGSRRRRTRPRDRAPTARTRGARRGLRTQETGSSPFQRPA